MKDNLVHLARMTNTPKTDLADQKDLPVIRQLMTQ